MYVSPKLDSKNQLLQSKCRDVIADCLSQCTDSRAAEEKPTEQITSHSVHLGSACWQGPSGKIGGQVPV